MRATRTLPLLLIVAACAGPQALRPLQHSDMLSDAADGDLRLHVVIEGARSQDGVLRLHLFDRSEGFPLHAERALRRLEWPLGNVTKVDLEGLHPGRYALAILHDENSDGRVERDWLGRPREGYAFSQGARIRAGLPAFEDAAFDLAENGQALIVRLIYP